MICFRFLVHFALLLTVPSMPFCLEGGFPISHQANYQQSPIDIDAIKTYDDIVQLIEQLESGALEQTCSAGDLEKINQFLVNLAEQGLLPNEPQLACVLENDIQHLLAGTYQVAEQPLYWGKYTLVPAFLGLSKASFSSGWEQTKSFVKKHKTAIIIGAVVVVAAVVVVGVVIAASSAGTIAAGAVAASQDSSPIGSQSEIQNAPQIRTTEVSTAFDEQACLFKEKIIKEQVFYSGDLTLEENGKALVSILAHDSFQNLNSQLFYPQGLSPNTQITSISGHQEIDRQLGTNCAPLFDNQGNITDFTTLLYQVRGGTALGYGNLDQAVRDLSKAIELNPTSPLPYLERGIAHFELGNYDNSVADYQSYATQLERKQPLSIPEFSLGFAKALPKGIYDSGEGLLLFLTDVVTKPIHTCGQMFDAVTQLKELARTEEWSTICQVLVPEIHELVNKWDTLSSDKKGELAGYAFGKYGADIILPGALAKASAKGLKGAKQISTIHKGLQTAEQTLLLESVASLESGAKIGEVIQSTQKTLALGSELGFSPQDLSTLKQAGKLESTVGQAIKHVFEDPYLQKCYMKLEKAQNFLNPYTKKILPEATAFELIQKAGMPTFPRPKGIPDSYLVRITDKGAGIEYMHPSNGTHISIRVMPGKPHSPFPNQQKPYVVQKNSGKAFDKHGNLISQKDPEVHIPIDEFIYRGDQL